MLDQAISQLRPLQTVDIDDLVALGEFHDLLPDPGRPKKLAFQRGVQVFCQAVVILALNQGDGLARPDVGVIDRRRRGRRLERNR